MKYLGPISDDKDLVNKEYVDLISDKLEVVAMLASEANFRSYVNSITRDNDFDYVCIEVFDTSDDIDLTKDDSAAIVTNFYDEEKRIIKKTTTDTMTLQSKSFEVDTTPYHVWVYADYDGTGEMDIYFSKDNGDNWVLLENETFTDLDLLVKKRIRFRLVMKGVVRLKNIAWGIS